jgi:hypothetical protein
MIVRHFTWAEIDGASGRVAVTIAEDRLRLVQIAGQAIPADLPTIWNGILNVIELPDGETVAGRALALNERRVFPVFGDLRVGMSGSVDARLRIARNADLLDYPVVASMHVSMHGKLNAGIGGTHGIWLGDYAALHDWLCSGEAGETPAERHWPAALESIRIEPASTVDVARLTPLHAPRLWTPPTPDERAAIASMIIGATSLG